MFIEAEKRIEMIEERLSRIERLLMSKGFYDLKLPSLANSTWITEKEARQALNLGRESLRKLRVKNIIRNSTVSGKNIKYYRKDVEAYLAGKKKVTK